MAAGLDAHPRASGVEKRRLLGQANQGDVVSREHQLGRQQRAVGRPEHEHRNGQWVLPISLLRGQWMAPVRDDAARRRWRRYGNPGRFGRRFQTPGFRGMET